MELVCKNEVYNIISACFEVYNELRPGLAERIYQEALAMEMTSRNIPFEREKSLFVYYKGKRLKKTCRADFVCYGNVIVELKALDNIVPYNEAQLINYLHVTKFPLGLLVNFGSKNKLEWKRYINIR